MLKAGSKRRRTKAQIEADREAEAAEKLNIQAKLAQVAAL